MNKDQLKQELETIRKKSPDKLLHPAAVVQAAKKNDHPLHKLFTWDDKKAAEKYRIEQARTLIRSVRVENPEDAFRPPVPAFVALNKDRKEQGGYRRIEDIVGDDELRDALRATAVSELRGWLARYRSLTELTGPVAEAAGIETEEEVTA